MGKLRSPLRWAGSKAWLVPILEKRLEDVSYARFVELFAGGASLSFQRAEKRVLLNDLNVSLCEFYIALKFGLSPRERSDVDSEQFLALRTRLNQVRSEMGTNRGYDRLEHADLFYFVNKYGFNGLWRENKKGQVNTPWNKKKYVKYPDFSLYNDCMSEWEIVNGSYDKVSVMKGDLVFADPPYDATFSDYTSSGFSWDDQVRLAEHLRDLGTDPEISVIATNSKTSRIVELYSDLGFTLTTESAPRNISSDGNRDRIDEMVAYLNLRQTTKELESVKLDSERLRDLVEEGAKLREEFERRTATSRIITTDDLNFRCR